MKAFTINITKNPEGGFTDGHFQFQAEGDYYHAEVQDKHIFVFGEVYCGSTRLGDDPGKFSPLLDEPACFHQFDGHFSLITISKSEPLIRMISSRLGGNRLYYRQSGEQLNISSRMENLAYDIRDRRFDAGALREELDYRWMTGDQSLISGIKLLPPATYVQIDDSMRVQATRFWKFPLIKKNSLPVASHSTNIRKLLEKSFEKAGTGNKRVAVLLSGGIDSSVLAGIAHSSGIPFTAISHQALSHSNPELETAKSFARHLGVEHRIIELDDVEVPALFARTTQLIEQAPRFQSSLILCKMFEALDGEFDQIIYGESADTLFGSNVLKRYRKRSKQRDILSVPVFSNRLSAKFLSPIIGKERLASILKVNPVSHYNSEKKLEMTAPALAWIAAHTPGCAADPTVEDLVDVIDSSGKREREIAMVKALLLNGAINNHFHETCALAKAHGLEILTPFADLSMINYAASLDDKTYYGNEYVKQSLRTLGESFYSRELMYLPKIGFPAPHKKWMATVLKPLWEQACKDFSINSSTNYDGEFCWTLIGLSIIKHFYSLDPLESPAID